MASKKAAAKKPAARPRARKFVTVQLDDDPARVAIAEVRLPGREEFLRSKDFIARATSNWWFRALDREAAEAVAQALIDVGEVSGFKTGQAYVAHLRKQYR